MSHGSSTPYTIIVDQYTYQTAPVSSTSGLMVYFGGGTSLLVGQSGNLAVSISGGNITVSPSTSVTPVSGLVAQSGNWLVGQSGALAVSVSGGTLPVTQSGPFAVQVSGGSLTVSPSTSVTPVSGVVGQSGVWAVQVSGGSIGLTGPLVVSHSGLAHVSGGVSQVGTWAVAISGGSIATTPPTSITAVSGLAAQSGNWIVGQSGTFAVSVSGGTLPITQSGPLVVSHSGLAHISGTVLQGGAWVVSTSGLTPVSGSVTQGGPFVISGSGLVHVSGSAFQAGPWMVGHSGLAHISGQVTQGGAWVVSTSGLTPISGSVTQTGSWVVALSGNSIVPESGANAVNALAVGGGTPHDAVDSGNPIKIGGKAISDLLPPAVASGDRVNAVFDPYGRQLTSHITPEMQKHSYGNYNTAQAGTNILTPSTGKRMAITSVVVATSGGTAGTLTMWFGASADTTWASTKQTLLRPTFSPSVSGYPGMVFTPPNPVYCSGLNHCLKVTTNATLSCDITVESYEW